MNLIKERATERVFSLRLLLLKLTFLKINLKTKDASCYALSIRACYTIRFVIWYYLLISVKLIEGTEGKSFSSVEKPFQVIIAGGGSAGIFIC